MSAGSLREEPEPERLGGPAGGALLSLPAGGAAAGALPAADGQDEGPGLHHPPRSEPVTSAENRPGSVFKPASLCLPADVETAQNALRLVHGYRGLGKPLVVEFGRERQQEEKQVNN